MNSQPIGRRDEDILLELAVYYETEGLRKPSTEEKIMERVKEFKNRIANGGVTLEDLAIMVYKTYGDKNKLTSSDTHG